jgi:hypothetical protein
MWSPLPARRPAGSISFLIVISAIEQRMFNCNDNLVRVLEIRSIHAHLISGRLKLVTHAKGRANQFCTGPIPPVRPPGCSIPPYIG